MKPSVGLSLTLSLLLLLPACGFHLRGSQTKSPDIAVYLHSMNAERIYQALQQQLGGGLRKERTAADYELLVSDESLQQNILTVSSTTGKAEEFTIRYTCLLTIRKVGGGGDLLHNQRIALTRDYTFDEDAVLSKFEEQQLLENELITQAAQAVIRHLNAITR